MLGGGNRRDEGSFTVSNTNVFAALESLRKKKKSGKDKSSLKGARKADTGKSKEPEEEKPQVFWSPTPLKVKSWADVDDEDDDDYYATTAPPQAMWAGSGLSKAEETPQSEHVEESESEDELLDEGDDDVDEEHEHEPELQELPEPIVEKTVELSPAPKETEKQLSKKERKKKELAELDAILADFGLNQKEKSEDEPSDVTNEKKEGQMNGDAEKDNVPTESKSAKKKKKKDKAPKEAKEHHDQPNSSDVPNRQEVTIASEEAEVDAPAMDVKERLKKVASSKKKKSNKEVDAAARAASAEAAARSAKLAAAKKKEKSHYNQQPLR